MPTRYDWLNLFDRAERLDCEMQVLVMKIAREEFWGEIPDQYIPLMDDGRIFDIVVEIWEYIRECDHNCCTAEECDYLSFVDDVCFHALEDIHILHAGIESGDDTAWRIWRKILEWREENRD